MDTSIFPFLYPFAPFRGDFRAAHTIIKATQIQAEAKMKRLFVLLILLVLLSLPAGAVYEPDTDYMQIMIDCARRGETGNGMAAAECRNEKIADMGLDYVPIDYVELDLLSRLIQAEAGSEWLSAEWKMAVGEVVLNRMASPEFPDTMREVIEQPGQYYGSGSAFFASLRPSEACVLAAKRLLEGERILCDPSVVFQANFVLGSGVHIALHDPKLGYTYLCYSSHPELYYG